MRRSLTGKRKRDDRGYYAKGNKSDKERQLLYDTTYTWNLKKHNKLMNTATRKQIHFMDIENKLVVTRGDGEREGHDRGRD